MLWYKLVLQDFILEKEGVVNKKMEAIRSWIGLNTSTSVTATTTHEKQAQERSKALVQTAQASSGIATDSERLAQLARAQTMQLGQLMDELKDIEAELATIDMQANRNKALQLIQTKKQVNIELQTINQKLQNTRNQQKILDQARMNLEQQVALQNSAVELKALAIASEELNVQEAVDTIQDAVKDLKHQDKLLAKPIFGGGEGTLIEQDEAEQELAALLARQSLPNVPVRVPPSVGGGTAVVVEANAAEEKIPTVEK